MRTAASTTSTTYAARALVLRARPLGEKDRIVTLFSPERGVISAVAKGARGTKSKLSALAQPFVLGRFLLATGRSLHIITQGEIETMHPGLPGDILKAAWAAYACELAGTLPEGHPDPEAWEILAVTLGTLDAAADDAGTESAGAWFEAQWLRHHGYAPTIGECMHCGKRIILPPENQAGPDQPPRITFSPTWGGTLCAACSRSDPSRLEIRADALRSLHRLERSLRPPPHLALDSAGSHDLFLCLRRCTTLHLDHRLRSQAFLDEIRAAKALD